MVSVHICWVRMIKFQCTVCHEVIAKKTCWGSGWGYKKGVMVTDAAVMPGINVRGTLEGQAK